MLDIDFKWILENLESINYQGLIYSSTPYLEKIWNIWKYLSAIIISTCLVIIIYSLKNSTFLQDCYLDDIIEFLKYKPAQQMKIEREWLAILKRLDSKSFFDYKQAIIEADNFLDKILIKINCKGENIEERLINMGEDRISNYNELIEARKIFRDIINDPNYVLDKEKAQQIIKVYQKSLENLGVIEIG